jgi:argininosuccinate synthase
MEERVRKIVLAYSGGLDTSVILRWLIETYQHAAHRAVESITLDREVMHLRDSLIPRFAEDAAGFIRLNALRLRIHALAQKASQS